MHAYSELYLEDAQRNLGHAFDFALNDCGISADDFMDLFCASGVAERFGRGNPKYVAGMNGCELVRRVADSTGFSLAGDVRDVLRLMRSREFWTGWSLAYYQWESGAPFREIQKAVPVSEMRQFYDTMHEADVALFSDRVGMLMIERRGAETRLAQYRRLMGYSQAVLARESGVSLRQIQLFEQRQREIGKAQANTVLRLAGALHCPPERLTEDDLTFSQ